MARMEGQAPEHGHSAAERADPSRLRISDADRHKVSEVLRLAAGDGRLDLDELDERLEATYAAKTYGELVPITSDLPLPAAGTTPTPAGHQVLPPAVSHSSSVSVMGDCTRRGVWEVPARHSAFSVMGGITLDLREARFAAREVVIDAYAVMAGIDIVVNPSTRVVVEGLGIMGEFSEARAKVAAELSPDSPLVRVRGLALMAGVSVKRKAMPQPLRKRLGMS